MKTKKNRLLLRDQARKAMRQSRPAIYVRVAREDDQDRKYGLDAQLHQIRDAVQRLDLQEPVLTFGDHASANGEITRTDFERAIADGADGRYELLLVERIDRFAHPERQLWKILAELINRGVCVYFVDEDVCAGLDDDWRDAVSAEITSAAEFSSKISQYVRKANQQRRRRGERTGRVPWGTRKPSGGDAR